jgi:hypothetical protein
VSRPGAAISNLRGVLHGGSGHAARLGTLGFLALVNGVRRREVVLVSNRHVLLAHGAGVGDPIYRPLFASCGETAVIRGDALDPVAEIADEGIEDHHRFQYPGEPAGDYFVDCASARVLGGLGASARPAAAARVHPLDAVGGRAPRVRLRLRTGWADGRVVAADATVHLAGQRRHNILVIRVSDQERIRPGDSGALVVNDRGRAVGLVWGCGDRDPALAYACHIQPVLHRLDVTLLTGEMS